MKEEFELKVCPGCDAPLPFRPANVSYFNISTKLCDDCFAYEKIKRKKINSTQE